MRKHILHPRTAAINQKQKNQSKQSRLLALQWLQNKFPAAFDNRLQIRPLNIGIMSEILQHAKEAEDLGISKSKLREAVVLYTRRLDYLACLKARELRIDLLGNFSIPVSEEDAERTALKIKIRIEKSLKMAKKANTPAESQNRGRITHSTVRTEEDGPSLDVPGLRNVSVKHKQSRTYDPQVVARLKEKLGLSVQKNELEDA